MQPIFHGWVEFQDHSPTTHDFFVVGKMITIGNELSQPSNKCFHNVYNQPYIVYIKNAHVNRLQQCFNQKSTSRAPSMQMFCTLIKLNNTIVDSCDQLYMFCSFYQFIKFLFPKLTKMEVEYLWKKPKKHYNVLCSFCTNMFMKATLCEYQLNASGCMFQRINLLWCQAVSFLHFFLQELHKLV